MALTITNHQIRSADTPHTAEPGDGGWTVTWLAGRGLTEGQAAAMESAGAPSQVPADRHLEVCHEGSWSRVDAWGRPARPFRTPPPLCRHPRCPGPGDGLACGWLWRCRGCWSRRR